MFEANLNDPTVLAKCIVVDQNLEDFHGKAIVVSQYKLNTIQCKKNRQTNDWTAQNIGQRFALFAGEAKNYHLIKDFLDFDNLIFVDDNEE